MTVTRGRLIAIVGIWMGLIGAGRLSAQTPHTFSVGGPTSGYIDRSGEFVELPERNYAAQCRFREGLAAFSVSGGYWGVMDVDGRVVVPARFGYIEDFSEGLAAACKGQYEEDVGGGFLAECDEPQVIDTTGRDADLLGNLLWEGLYGFIDRTGRYVVPPQYAAVGSFSEGLAWVDWPDGDERARHLGYIDRTGELVIELVPTGEDGNRWYSGRDFHEGLARVYNSRKYGYIDTTGAWAIAAEYTEAEDFADGRARVRLTIDDPWVYIDRSGTVVIEPDAERCESFREGMARVWIDGKVGFIDTSGRWVIEPQFDDAWDFSEGLAAVCVDGLWGYVDRQGQMVIEPRFQAAAYFREGIARVSDDFVTNEVVSDEITWRFIRTDGSPIGDGVFSWPTDFWEGRAFVMTAGPEARFGLKDASGQVILEPIYRRIEPFHEGLARILDEDGRYGYVNLDGRIVTPCQFHWTEEFQESLAAVCVEGKWGFIDTSGNIVVEPQFGRIQGFSEGLAAVDTSERAGYHIIGTIVYLSNGLERPGKWGYINAAGDMVIEPKFAYAGDFSRGVASVAIGTVGTGDDERPKEWRTINTAGQFVEAPPLDSSGDFSEGLKPVDVGLDTIEILPPYRWGEAPIGKWGYVDTAGETVIEPVFLRGRAFSGSLAAVCVAEREKDFKGKWGFVDRHSTLVIPPQFDSAGSFREQHAPVLMPTAPDGTPGRWGFINRNGMVVLPAIYDWAGEFSDGTAPVMIGHRSFRVDKNGVLYDLNFHRLPGDEQALLTSPQWRGEE